MIKDKNTRMERWKKHFSHVTNRETLENPINEYDEIDNEDIEVDTGEITLIVHGPGPPKMTFRYHSGGVMLTYIFENFNYSSFILCMIAMLNE